MLTDLGVGQVPAPKADRDRCIGNRTPGDAGVEGRVAVRRELKGRCPVLVADLADLKARVEAPGLPGQLAAQAIGGDPGRRRRPGPARRRAPRGLRRRFRDSGPGPDPSWRILPPVADLRLGRLARDENK